VSVREKFWVGPWFASNAKNIIRHAYDDCGHFTCQIVGVEDFQFLALCKCDK